jgi:hypothetical protein
MDFISNSYFIGFSLESSETRFILATSFVIPIVLVSFQQSIISFGLNLEVLFKYYSSKGSNFYPLGMVFLMGTTKQ